VWDLEEIEEPRQDGAHDEMLGRVLALEAAPGDEEEARHAIEDVQGSERVQRHAEPRILHHHDGHAAAEVRARRHAERGVLARLAEVRATRL
jgi:hypothetical protein